MDVTVFRIVSIASCIFANVVLACPGASHAVGDCGAGGYHGAVLFDACGDRVAENSRTPAPLGGDGGTGFRALTYEGVGRGRGLSQVGQRNTRHDANRWVEHHPAET